MASEMAVAGEEEIDYEGLGNNVPIHINMIAGALAGISEHALMFPVDVIRVSKRDEKEEVSPSFLLKVEGFLTDKNANTVSVARCYIYWCHTSFDPN